MAQTGVYTLKAFIDDIRKEFAASTDPRTIAQGVARHMKEILAVPAWLEDKAKAPAEAGYGRADLHLDDEYGHPGPGFLVMCSIQKPGKQTESGGVPHDHGASWVVYGVYKGAISQSKWRWEYPEGQWTSPRLSKALSFVQREGEVAFFLPGEIHSTENVHDGQSLVLRVEAQTLDRVVRHRYDDEANTAVALGPTGQPTGR